MLSGSWWKLYTRGSAPPSTAWWWTALLQYGLYITYLGRSLSVCPKVSCPGRSYLSRIILISSLLRIERSIILQLLQDDRSHIFGSFTSWFFFQSSGTLSCSQILCRSGYKITVDVWMSTCSASGGMLSGPAALSGLNNLMALVIPVLVGRLVLMSRNLVGSEMSAEMDVAGLCIVFPWNILPLLVSGPLRLRLHLHSCLWRCSWGWYFFQREFLCVFASSLTLRWNLSCLFLCLFSLAGV